MEFYLDDGIKRMAMSTIVQLIPKLTFPIHQYDLYCKIFKHLGIPLTNIMIGEVHGSEYIKDIQYLLAGLPNNQEIKSVSMAVPIGIYGTSATVVATLLLASNLPYFEMIGLNLISFSKSLVMLPGMIRTQMALMSSPLIGIKKLVLLYFEFAYGYSSLIHTFPNLKEIVFFGFMVRAFNKEYLLEFLRNGMTIYLFGEPDQDTILRELYYEFNTHLRLPFFISDTTTSAGLGVSKSFATTTKIYPNTYIGPIIPADPIVDLHQLDDGDTD
jgi:hypothetical protein